MNQKSSKVAMDNLPFIDKFIYISIKSSIDRGLFYGFWLPIVFLGSAQLTADFLHSWWPPDFIDFMIRGRRRGISAPLRILASLKHDETSKLPPNLMVYDACYHVPLYFLCIFVGYSIRWPVFTVCLPCVYHVSRESQNRQRVGPHQLLGRLQAGPAMLWVSLNLTEPILEHTPIISPNLTNHDSNISFPMIIV